MSELADNKTIGRIQQLRHSGTDLCRKNESRRSHGLLSRRTFICTLRTNLGRTVDVSQAKRQPSLFNNDAKHQDTFDRKKEEYR